MTIRFLHLNSQNVLHICAATLYYITIAMYMCRIAHICVCVLVCMCVCICECGMMHELFTLFL